MPGLPGPAGDLVGGGCAPWPPHPAPSGERGAPPVPSHPLPSPLFPHPLQGPLAVMAERNIEVLKVSAWGLWVMPPPCLEPPEPPRVPLTPPISSQNICGDCAQLQAALEAPGGAKGEKGERGMPGAPGSEGCARVSIRPPPGSWKPPGSGGGPGGAGDWGGKQRGCSRGHQLLPRRCTAAGARRAGHARGTPWGRSGDTLGTLWARLCLHPMQGGGPRGVGGGHSLIPSCLQGAVLRPRGSPWRRVTLGFFPVLCAVPEG